MSHRNLPAIIESIVARPGSSESDINIPLSFYFDAEPLTLMQWHQQMDRHLNNRSWRDPSKGASLLNLARHLVGLPAANREECVAKLIDAMNSFERPSLELLLRAAHQVARLPAASRERHMQQLKPVAFASLSCYPYGKTTGEAVVKTFGLDKSGLWNGGRRIPELVWRDEWAKSKTSASAKAPNTHAGPVSASSKVKEKSHDPIEKAASSRPRKRKRDDSEDSSHSVARTSTSASASSSASSSAASSASAPAAKLPSASEASFDSSASELAFVDWGLDADSGDLLDVEALDKMLQELDICLMAEWNQDFEKYCNGNGNHKGSGNLNADRNGAGTHAEAQLSLGTLLRDFGNLTPANRLGCIEKIFTRMKGETLVDLCDARQLFLYVKDLRLSNPGEPIAPSFNETVWQWASRSNWSPKDLAEASTMLQSS